MTFLFKMCGPDGDDLGQYNTAVPGPWQPRDLLYDGGRAAWRITAVLELDSSVYDGLWEVEPVAVQVSPDQPCQGRLHRRGVS